jgi:hypothetical protein
LDDVVIAFSEDFQKRAEIDRPPASIDDLLRVCNELHGSFGCDKFEPAALFRQSGVVPIRPHVAQGQRGTAGKGSTVSALPH